MLVEQELYRVYVSKIALFCVSVMALFYHYVIIVMTNRKAVIMGRYRERGAARGPARGPLLFRGFVSSSLTHLE